MTGTEYSEYNLLNWSTNEDTFLGLSYVGNDDAY
jgi:hypothetical protein